MTSSAVQKAPPNSKKKEKKKSIRMHFMLGSVKSAELKFTPYLMSVSLLLIGKRIPDPFDLLHNPLNAQVC